MGVFRLSFEASGLYRLEVSTPAPVATTSQADYVVHHAGVSETIRLDQSAVDGWQSLGDFLFSGGGDQWVGLGDATGEAPALSRAVVHDALRVTRLDLPGAEDGGLVGGADAGVGGDASVMPTSGGGCSVGRAGSWPRDAKSRSAFWLTLLVLSLIKRRRRRAASWSEPTPARRSP